MVKSIAYSWKFVDKCWSRCFNKRSTKNLGRVKGFKVRLRIDAHTCCGRPSMETVFTHSQWRPTELAREHNEAPNTAWTAATALTPTVARWRQYRVDLIIRIVGKIKPFSLRSLKTCCDLTTITKHMIFLMSWLRHVFALEYELQLTLRNDRLIFLWGA